MKTQFYLIVKDDGDVRISKARPEVTKKEEVSIFWGLELPGHLFQKSLLSAELSLEMDEIKPAKLKMKIDTVGDWLKAPTEED